MRTLILIAFAAVALQIIEARKLKIVSADSSGAKKDEWGPEGAFDKDTSSDLASNSCFFSSEAAGSWVEFTFKEVSQVKNVKLLRSSTKDKPVRKLKVETCLDAECTPCENDGLVRGNNAPPDYTGLGCNNQVGDRIRISSSNKNILLCDVVVKGEYQSEIVTTPAPTPAASEPPPMTPAPTPVIEPEPTSVIQPEPTSVIQPVATTQAGSGIPEQVIPVNCDSKDIYSHVSTCGKLYDGNPGANWYQNTCYHSKTADGSSWIWMDLGSVKTVTEVSTLSRSDCCGDRTAITFSVCSSKEDTDCIACGARTNIKTGVWDNVECAEGATGQYLRLEPTGRTYLQVCEIKITAYGGQLATTTSSTPAPTTTSSTSVTSAAPSGQPEAITPVNCDSKDIYSHVSTCGKLYDGNPGASWYQNTCYHSKTADGSSWIWMDLGSVKTVTEVSTLSRSDCCGDRTAITFSVCSSKEDTDCNACGARTNIKTGVWDNVECAEGATGQYLRLEPTGRTYLQLCELKVTGY